MFLRMDELPFDLPPQVCSKKADEQDLKEVGPLLEEYCKLFKADLEKILDANFYVLMPNTANPY